MLLLDQVCLKMGNVHLQAAAARHHGRLTPATSHGETSQATEPRASLKSGAPSVVLGPTSRPPGCGLTVALFRLSGSAKTPEQSPREETPACRKGCGGCRPSPLCPGGLEEAPICVWGAGWPELCLCGKLRAGLCLGRARRLASWLAAFGFTFTAGHSISCPCLRQHVELGSAALQPCLDLGCDQEVPGPRACLTALGRLEVNRCGWQPSPPPPPRPERALMGGEGAPSHWGPYGRLRGGPLFSGVHPVLTQLWILWRLPQEGLLLSTGP